MINDCIESILDDATMSPKAYCYKWDCGQGIYDELADYVPDMCIHLVGRTQAVMRHNLLRIIGGTAEYQIGDSVICPNAQIGEVIGFALDHDCTHCLVLFIDHGQRVILCPIDDARKLKVPTPKQLRTLIMGAIQSAASGDNYNAETAERKADYIMDVAHACFCNEPFPVGGAK